MNYLPLVVIPLACFIIYIRVWIQKRSMKRRVFKWNRDTKMILQIGTISSLYLAMWMPMQIAGLINLYWNPRFLIQQQFDYMYFFSYLIHFIYPFIVLFSYRREMLFREQFISAQAIQS